MTKPTTTMYQNFLDSLYNESPKAAFTLEAMRYSLAAETGLNEKDALEVCVRIVAAGRQAYPARSYPTRPTRTGLPSPLREPTRSI